jgi:NADH:ubiquinone oxidoreductase subunit 6 (subunit J)
MSQPKPISHLVAGSIIAALLIICSVVFYLGNMDQTGILAWLPYIIIIAGLILFINMYGNANHNQLTFGGLFSYGFKTTATLTLVVITFTVIFILMFPDVKEKGFELARKKMEEPGNLTGDEIEKRISTFKDMFWVFTIGTVLLVYAIVGAIGSALGAALTKKTTIPHQAN